MSEQKETGGPAFPGGLRGDDDTVHPLYEGMSLFDYYVGEAMKAAISGHFAHYGHESHWHTKDIVGYAREVAAAMLEARNK
jgi:hypothetical protein